MDRLSKQVVERRQAGILSNISEAQDPSYVQQRATIDTSIATQRTAKRLGETNLWLVLILIANVFTAISTTFLAYVLYSLLQALQDAANQINTTGL